jgi:3-hydroxypropanoate dehydrogenase
LSSTWPRATRPRPSPRRPWRCSPWTPASTSTSPRCSPIKPELAQYFEADETARNETGQFSATLQAGYFILSVRAHGLAAGPMAGFDAAGIDAEFFPDGRWHTLLVVNIGRPGQNPWFERLPRLDHSEVVQWA